MKVTPTSLTGVLIVDFDVFFDDRGYFQEIFKTSSHKNLGLPLVYVQDNLSMSKKAVVRGLHLQKKPAAQAKLVQCVQGRVFDVAVDVRPGSSTFGQFESVILDAKEPRALFIPEGFAHGFQALEEGTKVFYKCTNLYSKNDEIGIRFDDPDIKIPWPLPPQFVSSKDLDLPLLKAVKKDLL